MNEKISLTEILLEFRCRQTTLRETLWRIKQIMAYKKPEPKVELPPVGCPVKSTDTGTIVTVAHRQAQIIAYLKQREDAWN